jgi:hypothetical protein
MGRRISIPPRVAGSLALALCVVSAGSGVGACATGLKESDTVDDASSPLPDASTEHAATPDSSPPVLDTGPMPDDSTAPEATTPDTGTAETSPPDSSMVVDTGTPETSTSSCTPLPNTDTLPFAVDVLGKFIPSGWEGDISGLTMPNDPTCNGNRSSASALGNCHPVTYQPLPAGTGVQGWAGVLWQHPINNWGTAAGYAIPAGATKVSFWARGQLGGEIVSFVVGFAVTPTATAPCFDHVSATLANQNLTTTWTHYTIPLNGQSYTPGVIVPFGFSLPAAGQPTHDAGAGDAAAPASVEFFVDDIEWQP